MYLVLIKINGADNVGLGTYINTDKQRGHIVDLNNVITFLSEHRVDRI